MPNIVKKEFLNDLEKRFGQFKKLPKSLSLFELEEANVRIYIRYSKIHPRNQTFYGLRQEDLKKLEGGNSIICFLWENQKQPLFIPYGDYEEIFAQVSPASDGQYKVQIYIDKESSELYIANAGRFNIEAFYGWNILESVIDKSKVTKVPDLSHSQVQTLVGSIGSLKGFDVWIPPYDRNKLDKNIITELEVRDRLPDRYSGIYNIIKEIDVIWIKRGSSDLSAMFEVEHSTPIYSGLLRFNDIYLVEPKLNSKFSIVSNELRRSLFIRQVTRPTFKTSGLSEICNFLDYKDVYIWFNHLNIGVGQ